MPVTFCAAERLMMKSFPAAVMNHGTPSSMSWRDAGGVNGEEGSNVAGVLSLKVMSCSDAPPMIRNIFMMRMVCPPTPEMTVLSPDVLRLTCAFNRVEVVGLAKVTAPLPPNEVICAPEASRISTANGRAEPRASEEMLLPAPSWSLAGTVGGLDTMADAIAAAVGGTGQAAPIAAALGGVKVETVAVGRAV